MQHTNIGNLKIEKVSELEWYLTMESYHQIHHTVSCQNVDDIKQNMMTLDSFKTFHNGLKIPVISPDKKTIAFYAPFKDTINILPGCEIQYPLAFAIKGNLEWIQPESGNLIISSCTIDGKSGAKGEILNIKNISSEIVHLDIETDEPFCVAKIISVDEMQKTTTKATQKNIVKSEYLKKVNVLLQELFGNTGDFIVSDVLLVKYGITLNQDIIMQLSKKHY